MSLTKEQRAQFDKLRSSGLIYAMACAKAKQQQEPETESIGLDLGSPAEWEQDGFTMRAEVEHDDFQPVELSDNDEYFGKFGSYRTSPASIKVNRDDAPSEWRDWSGELDSDHQYYNPIEGTVSEYKRVDSGFGGCRAERYQAMLNEFRPAYKRHMAWLNDEWSYTGVVVTASKNGIELGSASLWGIESDAGEYYNDVARELSSEAIAAAQDALKALCS